jgi:membrane-bound serine protease (ClpP class)
MKQFIVQLILVLTSLTGFAQQNKAKVVIFDLKDEINPAATRITAKALNYAESINATLLLVHMNTYGGYVTDADSIRTRLLNTKIPTIVYIDNNAASAGALISLACDQIYMRQGASIGATTVVNETGEKAPDKYQSYMRKQMRSTAESHGKDTLINGKDTTFVYKRNPDIAEGMVDERIIVPGLDDSTKVITLTTAEAIKWGYCEGVASSIDEILELNNLQDAEIVKVEPDLIDKWVAFFANPALRSVLILLMIGGIYFELQSPGIGFPLLAALIAAVAYFAPLYLDGLAQNWEILIFILGIILIGLEIFVVPGFGLTGLSGITLVVAGLILSMIRNVDLDFSETSTTELNNAVASVLFAMLGLTVLLYFFGNALLKSKAFRKIVLMDTIGKGAGIQSSNISLETLINRNGVTHTALRPMGRIDIDGTTFEAKTYGELIDKGKNIKVISIENQYLVVKEMT